MLLFAAFILLVAFLWWKWQEGARFRNMINKLQGPKPLPVLGNALQLGTNTVEILTNISKYCAEFHGSPFRLWIGPSTVYVITTDPMDLEIILGSNKILDKANLYKFIEPWLGDGLLTTAGDKWRKHRKILTPSFHFKILEEFIDVFNSNGEILIERLKQQVDGPAFDIYKDITLYALDNICETAMGVKVNAQKSNGESEYVDAIRDMTDITMQRSFKPWLANGFLFKFSKYSKIQSNSLKILHGLTRSVIKQRKEEITAKKATVEEVVDQSDGVKKRLAFLDLLIESTFEGSLLTDENIREEVDTFMFAGHDTTSSGMSFALWLLSWHQDIQDQVFQELMEVFPDPEEPVSFRGLQELKVMERVLKESLRLYPSVPMFARQLYEDLTLSKGQVIPKGATLSIVPFMIHRNPDVWPDPLKFDPDRFMLESLQGRHPYAYIPFSAGPRNCIGQKFAMLELKSSLAHVLRAYKILPGSDKPDLSLASDLVLLSATGLPVKIVKRANS